MKKLSFLIALLWCSVLQAAVITPFQGGTGVSNDNAATLTRSGAHALTITTTGTTGVTLPTSGTLYAIGGALGTPSSGTATNLTGLPISTGISGLGTGVAAFLVTPTSANLATAVTNETGSGALVFATSPTLITPALGTPASGTVTNLTGTASININGTVGATTPAAGFFTAVTNGALTAGRVPFAGTAGLMTDSNNYRYSESAGASTLVVGGTGSGTSGLTMSALSGITGGLIFSNEVVMGTTNYALRAESAATVINSPGNVSSTIQFRIINASPARMTVGGAAGQGLSITAGTATTAVSPLSATQTRNGNVAFPGLDVVYTDTLVGAGSYDLRIRDGASGATERMAIATAGGVGFGTATPNAGVEVLGTTEQLRLSYDGSNSVSHTVSSAGAYTIAPTGASITMSKLVIASGGVRSSAITGPSTALTLNNTSAGTLTFGSNAVTPASTGTRFLCISTAGVVTSSATACAGT